LSGGFVLEKAMREFEIKQIMPAGPGWRVFTACRVSVDGDWGVVETPVVGWGLVHYTRANGESVDFSEVELLVFWDDCCVAPVKVADSFDTCSEVFSPGQELTDEIRKELAQSAKQKYERHQEQRKQVKSLVAADCSVEEIIHKTGADRDFVEYAVHKHERKKNEERLKELAQRKTANSHDGNTFNN
jgi:hypothetical protein